MAQSEAPQDHAVTSGHTQPDAVSLYYHLGMDDVVALQRYHAKTSKTYRTNAAVWLAYLAALTLVPASINAVVLADDWAVPLAIGVITFLAAAGIIYLCYWGRVDTWVRREYTMADPRAHLGCRVITLGEHGYIRWSPTHRAEYAYGSVHKIAQTDDYTFVFISPMVVDIIPRSAVVQGDYDTVIADLRRRVAAAPHDPPEAAGFLAPWPRTLAADDTGSYCRKCRYLLNGVAHNECPECGTPFEPRDSTTLLRRLDDRAAAGWTSANTAALLFGLAGIIGLAFALWFSWLFSQHNPGGTLTQLFSTTGKICLWASALAASNMVGYVIGRRYLAAPAKMPPSPPPRLRVYIAIVAALLVVAVVPIAHSVGVGDLPFSAIFLPVCAGLFLAIPCIVMVIAAWRTRQMIRSYD